MNIPSFYLNAPVEDEPIKLLALSQGKGYYLNDKMCVYRKNHPGSWNDQVKRNTGRSINHYKRKIELYDAFDKYTEGIYSNAIKYAVNLERFNIDFASKDYKKLDNPNYRFIFDNMSYANRFRLKIAYIFPKIYGYIDKMYKHFKYKN